MLYNKNNVRKTNDKKVLHKVGKQWKVVSIALLMAIGGGAAVATHANAQSNNGVNASTSAEVEALEQKPAVPSAVSSAPSSVAPSSASAKPSSAISYQNGYNGSAASYHAKAMSDNSGYKVNNATVQHYVNSLNAAFPSATNSLNNNYTSAATKTSADQAAAQSYSAIANNKNYSSQVSSLASKAGLTYSGFVQSVSYQASNFASQVSTGSSLTSEMSTVNSYAQLINEIDNNSALSQEYSAKSVSASANFKVANDAQSAANSVYTHFVNASADYQEETNIVKNKSTANSDAEKIALVYAGLDANTTNSLANSLGYSNSSATSNRTHAIVDATNSTINTPSAINSANSAHIVPFDLDNYAKGNKMADHIAQYIDVKGNFKTVFVAPSNANARATSASAAADAMFTLFSDTSQEDQYNSASAAYNSELVSYASDSASVSSAINSASAALTSANNSLSDATSESVAYNVLGNHPLLGQLFAEYRNGQPRNASAFSNASSAYRASASAFNNEFSANSTSAKSAILNALTSGAASQGSNESLANEASSVVSELLNPNAKAMPMPVMAKLLDAYNTPSTRNQAVEAINVLGTNFDLIKSLTNDIKTVEANAISNATHKPANVTYSKIIADFLANPSQYVGMAENSLKNNHSANSQKMYNELEAHKNDAFLKNNHTGLAQIVAHDSQRFGLEKLFNDVLNGNETTAENYLTAVGHNLGTLPKPNANNLTSLGNDMNKDLNDMKAYGPTKPSVAAGTGILNPLSYASAKATVNNYLNGNREATSSNASSINSLNDSVAASYAGVQSASNSYSNATEENVTLAGIYATSYSDDANSDEAVESAAKNSLDNFYLNHADAKYANASSAAASFAAAEPNDAALAHANGVHVYNYAPKYIRVIRNGVLHSNTEYSKGSSIVSVPKGTQLTVLGVGFAQDGTTRYAVNYKGKKGYFTANVNYVTPAFLSAANGVSVTTNRAVKLYKNAKFTKKAGKTLPAGTTVPNVDVVSEDSIYGGFTRVETPSGDFFTANSLYVGLTGASANTNTGINDNNANIMNNTNNGANNGANNGVGFWN